MTTNIYNSEVWTSGCPADVPVCIPTPRPSPFYCPKGTIYSCMIFTIRFNNKLVGIKNPDYIDGLEETKDTPPQIAQLLEPDIDIPLILTNDKNDHILWTIIYVDNKELIINIRYWTHCIGYNDQMEPVLTRRNNKFEIEIQDQEEGSLLMTDVYTLSSNSTKLYWAENTSNNKNNWAIIGNIGKTMDIDPTLNPYDMGLFFSSSVIVSKLINGKRFGVNYSTDNLYATTELNSQNYIKWNIETSRWSNNSHIIYATSVSDNDKNWSNKSTEKITLSPNKEYIYLFVLPNGQIGLGISRNNKIHLLSIKPNEHPSSLYLTQQYVYNNWSISVHKDTTTFLCSVYG